MSENEEPTEPQASMEGLMDQLNQAVALHFQDQAPVTLRKVQQDYHTALVRHLPPEAQQDPLKRVEFLEGFLFQMQANTRNSMQLRALLDEVESLWSHGNIAGAIRHLIDSGIDVYRNAAPEYQAGIKELIGDTDA